MNFDLTVFSLTNVLIADIQMSASFHCPQNFWNSWGNE